MLFDSLIIIFFVYSILGYISEVIYCSIGQRHLVNRGFLYGPWLPIYGFGGVVVKIFLEPLAPIAVWGPILVFILSMVLTSIIEYIGSWALEKAFSIKLWDYSKKKVNINGRVCLLNSTLFGIGGLAITYLINPLLENLIAKIPLLVQRFSADIIIIVLSLDFIMSCVKMNAVKSILEDIRVKGAEIEHKYKLLIKQGKEELAKEYREKLLFDLDKMKESASLKARRILRSFPTCTSCNAEIAKQLESIRGWIKDAKAHIENARNDLKGVGNGR